MVVMQSQQEVESLVVESSPRSQVAGRSWLQKPSGWSGGAAGRAWRIQSAGAFAAGLGAVPKRWIDTWVSDSIPNPDRIGHPGLRALAPSSLHGAQFGFSVRPHQQSTMLTADLVNFLTDRTGVGSCSNMGACCWHL